MAIVTEMSAAEASGSEIGNAIVTATATGIVSGTAIIAIATVTAIVTETGTEIATATAGMATAGGGSVKDARNGTTAGPALPSQTHPDARKADGITERPAEMHPSHPATAPQQQGGWEAGEGERETNKPSLCPSSID